MKKKLLLPIIIGAVVLLGGVGAWLLFGMGSNYQIVVNETDQVKLVKDALQVEAGDTVTIPQAEVYDRDGNFCKDFTVARSIVDEKGAKKAGTLQMKHGQVYSVTYVADNGSEQIEKTYEIRCLDTTLPTVSLLKLQKSYNVKDEVIVQIKEASKDIDYDKSSIKLVNVTKKEEKKLSFKEAYSFVAEKESEQYEVVCNLTDENGNKNELKFPFVVAGKFQDDNIDKNDIWDFDEIGYMNNVKVAGTSDDLKYEIVTDDLPKDTNEVGIKGGAMKLELKAGETYDFTLVDGNEFKIMDSSAIGFKIWADEVVDIFEVYNVEDNTMTDLSWKVVQREQWQAVEFDPTIAFAEDYMFHTVRILISCERDVTVYIDSVYYQDYVEPWRDTKLPAGVLATFDHEGYLERVLETSNVDSATYGGTWDIVTEIPGTTDFSGGALKLVSKTDATIGYDKNARDGFKFQLFDRLSEKEIGGLIFKIYCEDPQVALAVNFVDKKMGESRFIWPSLDGAAGNWINVIIPREEIVKVIDGYEDITHLNIRFIRSASTMEEGKEEYISYIDQISLFELDYSKVKYTFNNDYDMRVVSSVGNGTGVKAADKNANDGWALKGTSVYADGLSGIEVAFNNLKVSDYSSIYVRLRGTDSIEMWLNGEYANYATYKDYTEVDILPYLLNAKETNLKSLSVGRKNVAGLEVYIDEIKFITKANAPKYKDFTVTLADFGGNVGTKQYNNFEGGYLSNVVSGSVKKGTLDGKTDVLQFTPKKDSDGEYSGGGLFVDFSKKLPNGKIQSTVDFDLNLQVYADKTAALRVGLVWGKDKSNISWKNYWIDLSTEVTGWQTVNISSKVLRALDDCGDKEITGIYLASHTWDYTFGLKEVNVDFKPYAIYPTYQADSSYLSKRDDNSIYISNFDSSTVLANADEVGLNPWSSNVVDELGSISHGTLTNADGSYTGIKLKIEANNAYSGFKYHLPENFNMKNAKKLVFRIASEDWTNGYVPAYIYLTEGSKKVNVIEYCDVYVGTEAAGTSIQKVECLDGVNYRTVCLALDVEKMVKATGMSTIDGFIFGHSNNGLVQVLDEVYYTTGQATAPEPVWGELVTTYFNTGNTTSDAYQLTDTPNGLQITGAAWAKAAYYFDKALNGADIETMTVRYKVTGGESAIMYFWSGSEYFYVQLDGIPEQQIVEKQVDADGFTIVTFNFQTFSMDAGDTWLPEKRGVQGLTAIELCCNNAAGAPTFDYVAYNVELSGGSGNPEDPEGPEQTGLANTEFAQANTEANGYTLSDTANGLQITGAAWVYAMHTLETPINGADIQTITVRYKKTGGEAAIMKFFNEDGSDFYVHLDGIPEQQIVKQEVDADGFTIVTFNFATFSMESTDTWLPADREAKKLTQIGLCCNNASGAPTFDYVAYNVVEEEEGTSLVLTEAMMNETGGYSFNTSADGITITGAAWSYARHYLASPISGANTTYLTVRYKVTGGEAAIMKFYNEEDEFFYVHLNGIPDGQKVSETVDEEGFTIVTIDFQSFQMDAGDTWLPATRGAKNLATIGLCCNNASGAPTFGEIKIK